MKIKYAITTLLVAVVLTTISCKKEEALTETAKPTFDIAVAKTSVETAYKEFEKAFNSKDSVALANCYATDAKLMGPNDKAIEGKAAIQKTFGMWMKADTPKIALQLVDAWGDETNLVAENKWTMTGKDGKVVDEGKSLEVYKMEDGRWKLYRDCYNSNVPALK